MLLLITVYLGTCALQELFAAMDTNNDGRIDSQDLHNALEKVRFACTQRCVCEGYPVHRLHHSCGDCILSGQSHLFEQGTQLDHHALKEN